MVGHSQVSAARSAEVTDIVTRSISGHATEDMQRHYSTVSPEEQRESLARVISLLDHKAARAPSTTAADVGTTATDVGHAEPAKGSA